MRNTLKITGKIILSVKWKITQMNYVVQFGSMKAINCDRIKSIAKHIFLSKTLWYGSASAFSFHKMAQERIGLKWEFSRKEQT